MNKPAIVLACLVLLACGDEGPGNVTTEDTSENVSGKADQVTVETSADEILQPPSDVDQPEDTRDPEDQTSDDSQWDEDLQRDEAAADEHDRPEPPPDLTNYDTEWDAEIWSNEETVEDSYQPGPIPLVDEDGLPQPCQAAMDDPWYFQFLDNLCNEKVYPSDQDRDRVCPVTDHSPLMTLQDGSAVEYNPAYSPVVVDGQALKGVVPDSMRVMVILIKRIDGIPHYRYISNGFHDVAMQPWSTTKFLAVANGAAYLRTASNYGVGLTASVKGYKLGDLVTAIHTYDNNPVTSNGLAAYFHDIGGRQQANALIHDLWLKRPSNETFGGNYGDASPTWLGFTFLEPGGGPKVTIQPDTYCCFNNNLSLFTLAEALKRLAVHMDEPTQRLPGIQWADIKQLFYGAEDSAYGQWGGMSRDTAIYIQMGHDIEYVEDRSKGQWTIFSKLGLGSQGQFMDVGHACWPVIDDQGNPVPGWGREFVIATHLDSGGATWDERDRLFATYYRKIITRIVDGRL